MMNERNQLKGYGKFSCGYAAPAFLFACRAVRVVTFEGASTNIQSRQIHQYMRNEKKYR